MRAPTEEFDSAYGIRREGQDPPLLSIYVGEGFNPPVTRCDIVTAHRRAMRAPTVEFDSAYGIRREGFNSPIIRCCVWKSQENGSFGALRLLRTTDKTCGLSPFIVSF